jgi:murein DD-endopeptidase MepM/ murein hydrolase activator NlpD
MPKFTGQTDRKETFELPSAIIDIYWHQKEGLVGGTATLEVRTIYVHHGAPVKLLLRDKEAKVIATLEGGKMMDDIHRRIIPLGASAAGGVFCEVELPLNKLKASGPMLKVGGAVKIESVAWKDKSGKELSEVRRAQETVLEAKVSGVKEGETGFFSIFEKRQGNHLHRLIELRAKVEKGKMALVWTFGHSANPALIYSSDGTLKRTGEKYEAPVFFIEANVAGAKKPSAEAKLKDWAEIKVVDDFGRPIADRDVTVVMPDGSEKKETSDKNGMVFLDNLLPGALRILLGRPKEKKAGMGDVKEVERQAEGPNTGMGDLKEAERESEEGFRFPLPKRPTASYKVGGRAFGSARPKAKLKGRVHAGCDLIAPVGTEVYAVADGTVWYVDDDFFDGTGEIAIDHGEFIARYCETRPTFPSGIKAGAKVTKGQLIGFVGKFETFSSSMLHFELYGKTAAGSLTDYNRPPYYRRKDLINPTGFLDKLEAP